MTDFSKIWVDLAQPRLGSEVVFATDDFFADRRLAAGSTQRSDLEQQLAAGHGHRVCREQADLAGGQAIAHDVGFRNTTRIAS